jgi:nucleoside-diphosphate-sugar epimerase
VLDDCSRGRLARLTEVERSAVEMVEGDIRDPDIVSRACKGVDGVCHLAFVNGTGYFYERTAYVLDVGVKGMVNVIDGCLRANVPELIVASSSEVYQSPPVVPTPEEVPLAVPDPHNARYSYGAGKIISEVMAVNYGRQYFERVVIFRPHNVFGANMGWEHVIPQFVDRLRRLGLKSRNKTIPFPIQGTGRQTRAFIYIDDFVSALMLLMQKGEHLGVYNIGTRNEISIRDLAHKVAGILGISIDAVPGTEAPGGTLRRCPNVEKIEQLGFAPRVNFEEALEITVNWYRQQELPTREGDVAVGSHIFLGRHT